MKTIIHRATTRGHANYGWLNSYHTFSFGQYHHPERIQFGALRVLNDDVVSGGMGFGTHPHDNMEIVSIPLKGDLEHKDDTGNQAVIRANDVQIMSAGTGIRHSEFNHNKDQEVNFLQIWVFPKEKDISPRYEQKTFAPEDRLNQLLTVVSPEKNGAIWINQDAYFALGNLEEGFRTSYQINKAGNGVYTFVIEGEVGINGQTLEQRDGIGISEAGQLEITAKSQVELLLIEVPMS